jgi:hypothetical protein
MIKIIFVDQKISPDAQNNCIIWRNQRKEKNVSPPAFVTAWSDKRNFWTATYSFSDLEYFSCRKET